MMKWILVVSLVFLASTDAAPRKKREAFELPDGADILVGSVRTSFRCPENSEGYYADIENNCQIFHVCHTVVEEDGPKETLQYSFLCGNQTVFNQLTFGCSLPEEAVPCQESASFFYLNDNLRLGDPDVPFLVDQDIQRAAPLIQGAKQYAAAQAPPRG